ncbi:hypothetical protein BJX68DRAFT_45973 [Aspergillus pseudodeflectus]|uniref:Zn(2)-C6 fungal-type domain-containing protein n=1 Tax=Aspergillus pseudodeflectus TaxID=176178 RepID=A0ABR4KN63_9EURO
MPETADRSGKERKRPAPRGTAFYPRKRANTACQVCRSRKTKCDNRKPSCSYCLSVGAVCNQSPVDLSSFDPASLKILERLDELEQVVREQHLETTWRTRAAVVTENANSLGQPAHSLPPGGEAKEARLLSISPESPDRLLRLPVFGGRPLPEGPLTEGPPRELPASREQQRQFVGFDTSLPGGVSALLDNFFEYVHCKNPVLEEAWTRRLVLSVALEGADSSASSCLALLVCALGRIAAPFGVNTAATQDTGPGSAAYAESQALFQAAQRRVGVLIVTAREEDSLIAPQCLLLSGLYMMCVFQPFSAWQFFMQALAASQRFTFLRRMYAGYEHNGIEAVHSAATASRGWQEQAVYWSAWKSERELRRFLCLPDFPAAGENGRLYPPMFPTPPAVVSDNSADEQRQRSSWLFYLAEISLRRLLNRVSGEISALYSTTTLGTQGSVELSSTGDEANLAFLTQLAALVREYEEQGRQWAASLPVELSLDSPAEYDNVCRFVLRGHYAEYREILYWPFLAYCLGCYSPVADLVQLPPQSTSPLSQAASPAQHMPSPSATQQTYINQLAAECLEIQSLRIHINKPGFRHRHHGTLFLIYGCVRSALTLLAAAPTGLQMPRGWQNDVACVPGDLLPSWQVEMPWFASWQKFLFEILDQL